MADSRQVFTNNGTVLLTFDITNVATSMTVQDGSVFNAIDTTKNEFQLLTLDDSTNIEIVKATDIVGNVITIVRAQEGTTGLPFLSGTTVEARITKGTLDFFPQGFDNSGNQGGLNSLDLQSNRYGPSRIAKGASSITLGDSCFAEGLNAISIGTASDSISGSSATPWAATTSFSLNATCLLLTSGNHRYIGYCMEAGDTGSTIPVPTTAGEIITDGTVTWYVVYVTNDGRYSFSSGTASTAMGEYCTAINSSKAFGNNAVSFGDSSHAVGANSVAINSKSVGEDSFSFNTTDIAYGRIAKRSIFLGKGYSAIGDTARIVGPDYIPFDDEKFELTDGEAAAYASAKPQVFTGPPLCLGAKSWIASTTYKTGDVVTPTTPNGYSYYARIINFETYFDSATSGGTEPGTWPTTVYSSVYDNGITWVCVDPASVIITLPDYIRFIPTEVGFIGQADMASATTQPYISFGVSGTPAKWLISTQTTQLTGAFAGQKFDSDLFANTEGSKTLAAALVTIGDGATTGRFYWKGICIEVFDA